MGEAVIGITCGQEAGTDPSHCVGVRYVQAVAAAGGVPLLLPYVDNEDLVCAMVERLDGLLLPGGVDVDPHFFGEEPLESLGRIDPETDALELQAARLALEADLPILGICRGIQLLNVAAGGSLYQDIGAQVKGTVKHRQDAPRWYATHEVTIEEGSQLHEIFGTTALRVNSFHHQAVKVVAPDFRVTAKAKDAVVEGIESRRHRFAIGVQWHPEGMWQRDPLQAALFREFVAAARRVARGGR